LQIQILSRWLFESLNSKNKNNQSEFNHIWRWLEMRFQSDFYRCVSVWMF